MPRRVLLDLAPNIAGTSSIVPGDNAVGRLAPGRQTMISVRTSGFSSALAPPPQLVLDGLELAPRAVGARRAYLYIHAASSSNR